MQQHMAEQALNCVLIFICTHTSMRTHMRTTAKHPLLLLLLYTDVNYQNEQNMFNVFDATRPVHAIYLACRVSLIGLALLLGFALLLGTSCLLLRSSTSASVQHKIGQEGHRVRSSS